MTLGTKTTTTLAALATALLLGAGTGVALAQTPAGTAADLCQKRGGRFLTPEDREAVGAIMLNRLKTELGLTDQQAEDVRATMRARRDALRAEGQALCEARVELSGLLAQQGADPAAVRAAGERVKAAQARLLDGRLDGYLELRAKLTPEQWAKWVELRKAMGPRGHRHMGHRFM
jgi:Spy/CpxP family protein refolding chaperone